MFKKNASMDSCCHRALSNIVCLWNHISYETSQEVLSKKRGYTCAVTYELQVRQDRLYICSCK